MHWSLPAESAVWQRAGFCIRRARQAIEMRKAGQGETLMWLEFSRRFSCARESHPALAPFGCSLSAGSEQRQDADAPNATGLAEFKPWREVGWIFRDGGCTAIEFQGPLSRIREVVD